MNWMISWASEAIITIKIHSLVRKRKKQEIPSAFLRSPKRRRRERKRKSALTLTKKKLHTNSYLR